MSNVVVEKKKRSRKVKAEEPAPEPISVKAAEVDQKVQPEPEVEETSPGRTEDSDLHAEDDSKVDQNKIQKKKLCYEELRNDVEDLQNKLLEDISNAKEKKNKDLSVLLKNYEKLVKRIRGNLKKIEPKEKKTVTRTQPSGFNKPLPITDEIARFAGWNPSELKSRTDVTSVLCGYIEKQHLQKEGDRRVIIPDEKLSQLLRFDSGKEDPLTYSTMQRYIGHLFQPVEAAS